MALEEKLTKKAKPSGEELDLKIAVLIAQDLIDKGGIEPIEAAVKSSSNPGQVIGQFMMQLAQQLMESMPAGMELSPSIMLIPGGWVEQVSDYLQEEYGIKKDIMDKAEVYVGSTAQQMTEARQAPQGQEPAPQDPAAQAPPEGVPV